MFFKVLKACNHIIPSCIWFCISEDETDVLSCGHTPPLCLHFLFYQLSFTVEFL